MQANHKENVQSTSQGIYGFTLLELLVTVSIIAIIAGLLLSVSSQIRKQGAKIHAVNNLRSIGIASICFINDSNGTVPGPLYSSFGLYYTDNKFSGGLGATLWSYLNAQVPPMNWSAGGVGTLESLRDKYRERQGEGTKWRRWTRFYPSGIKSDSTGIFDPNGNKSDGTWPTKYRRLSNGSEAIFMQDEAMDYNKSVVGSGYPLYGKYLTLYWDFHVGYLDTQVNAMTQWW